MEALIISIPILLIAFGGAGIAAGSRPNEPLKLWDWISILMVASGFTIGLILGNLK